MITVSINDKKYEFENELNITSVLESIGFADKPVVVELDQQALLPKEYSDTTAKDGSSIEIITIAAGG